MHGVFVVDERFSLCYCFYRYRAASRKELSVTIEEMRKRKKELGYTNRQIAEKSGIPFGTVQKVFSGTTSSPRRETILALERLLKPHTSYESGLQQVVSAIRESFPAYGAEKRLYTLDDYLALPDDQRVELIDGVFYDLAAPTGTHQAVGGYIYKIFMDFILSNKGLCYPFISPVDVQLDADDKTVVQPDVLVLCDRKKYKNGRVFGAPDLVIEVLSSSTRKKDMQLKLYKYGNAGVKEYWMIDPKKKAVIQYDLENIDFPVIYGSDAVVPVLIWGGKCKVNFNEIWESVSFLLEADYGKESREQPVVKT